MGLTAVRRGLRVGMVAGAGPGLSGAISRERRSRVPCGSGCRSLGAIPPGMDVPAGLPGTGCLSWEGGLGAEREGLVPSSRARGGGPHPS